MAPPEMKRRGLLIILSSPSGAGKSTLARRLMDWDDTLSFSVSATTRAPRSGEVDGQHYHFLDEPAFKAMVAEGAMLEHAHVFGNFYGSPMAPVREAIEAGRDVLFDIDWQGAQQIKTQRAARPCPVDLHPAAIDPRAAASAGKPGPGRGRGHRQADAEKLGRDQPLGRV
jgi:guanylate kinase